MARAGLTPDRVRDAAIELVRSVGFEELSLGTLARELGVRVPSLYNHVDNLDTLRAAVSASATNTLDEALAPAQTLEEIAHAYLAFARAEPGLYRASLRAPSVDNIAHEAAALRVLERIESALAEFPLSVDARIDAIRGLRALLHGFVELTLAGAFEMERPVEASFDGMLQNFRLGLERAKPIT
ncbi:TetR/AcrR family transcriptional regulator [Mycetocola tolaasinivorans]|uniref:TetR/AcrR family transcriptional regulator n=1 Tax=Mycetocola tolaasinivorans TaxID=76635 RepID=UPI0015FFF71F|nr:TetR/AcrR family transcriptional regulator [Mycetocola tolaasinivorans]